MNQVEHSLLLEMTNKEADKCNKIKEINVLNLCKHKWLGINELLQITFPNVMFYLICDMSACI